MTKLYSFECNSVRGVFFDDGVTTWWPLTLLLNQVGATQSATWYVKKYQIPLKNQKRFDEFGCFFVSFPKKSYFISQKRFLELLLTLEDTEKSSTVSTLRAFVENPERTHEVVKKISFVAKKKSGSHFLQTKAKKSIINLNQLNFEEQSLKETIFNTLELAKQLTILLEFETPMDEKTKEYGLTVTKQLNQFFQKIKVKKQKIIYVC